MAGSAVRIWRIRPTPTEIKSGKSGDHHEIEPRSNSNLIAPVLFFVFSAFMLPQKSPAGRTEPVQTEAALRNRDLTSQEEVLQQSHHTMAVIYREMAVATESDSASVRDLKHHYERLAEN